jgi:murein L,D-transpeptidase YafK
MTMKRLIFRVLAITVIGLFGYYFFPDKKLPVGKEVDSIVVLKSKRKLQVYSDGQLLKTYKISLGRNPNGDKQFQGDKRTPEGVYIINGKNPHSGYHKNLGISYPNQEDIEQARKSGKSAGGDIKIHGFRNGYGFVGKFHRWMDWTNGCIALTDKEVDELYNAVKIGTRIEIKP